MTEILVYNFDDIDFDKIVYASPVKKKPAGFFSDISINNDNLYLEFNAIKTSDLVSLDNNKILELDINLNPDLLFFNQFDESFKNIAFNNKEQWFNTEIPKEVIDDFYTPLIYDNQFRASLLEDDLINVTNFKGDTIDYNSIENGEQISLVIHLTGLRFLKKQFYCNVEIKQVVKVNNYQLVDYDSIEEDADISLDEEHFDQLDLENSEVIDLEVKNIEEELPSPEEVKDEIYKELQLKLEQRQNAERDLEQLRMQISEKENLLRQTNTEVEELQNKK
jgi:hypothetical protein